MTKAIKNIDINAIAESIIDDLFDKGQTRILNMGETHEFDLLIKIRDLDPDTMDYAKESDEAMMELFDASIDDLIKEGKGVWADVKPIYEEDENDDYWYALIHVLPTILWWQLQSRNDLERNRDDFMREFEQDCEDEAEYYNMVAYQSRSW